MSPEKLHHTSKKNRYTVILIPNEDASNSKNIHFTFWHLGVGLCVLLVFFVCGFWVLIVYTPLGQLLPVSSPGLRNQYSRELISLNERMTRMMEELVELRVYNVKLRKALGEKVVLSDSGIVDVPDTKSQKTEFKDAKERAKLMSQRVEPTDFGDELQPITGTSEVKIVERPVQFPAIFPTQGYITRGFDPKMNHFGMDIAGKTGSVIYAAAEGNIVFEGWTHDDGYLLIISHANGFMTFYKHNEALLKSAGAHVKRGEVIATLGNSGETSQGPHVHFEIWKDGVPVDPSLYVINYNL